jgi:hypothetical protein
MAEFDPEAMVQRFAERASADESGSLPVPADLVDPERFRRAIEAIDAANSLDPSSMTHRGRTLPKELLHARLMTSWVQRLDPGAGEVAHLAARAHHFRRWTRPRGDYPEGRAGYLRWRAAAKRAHAAEVAELLSAHGYGAVEIEQVGGIVRKDGLGSDPRVQVHEDALCLVFLETQLVDVADKVGEDQMVDILVRTIPKMSGAGVEAALSLDLDPRGAELLARAASAPGAEDRSGH